MPWWKGEKLIHKSDNSLCFLPIGKVPVPVQLGKKLRKNENENGKIGFVKSSDWEIGVFYSLLTNSIKLITKFCQVFSTSCTFSFVQAIEVHGEIN